jgi:hypothetical protein
MKPASTLYDGNTPLAMALVKKQTELIAILRSHSGIE